MSSLSPVVDTNASRLIVPLMALLVTLVPGIAAAHAHLLSASPAPDATLDRGPSRIVLTFNEAVMPVAVTVTGDDGVNRAEGRTPLATESRIELDLGAALPAGAWRVNYRAMSDDAHTLEGHFSFRVGPAATTAPGPAPVTAAAPEPAPTPAWAVAAVAARAAYMLGLLLTAGGALFLWLVPAPSLQPTLERATRRLALGTLVAAVVHLQVGGAEMAGSLQLPDLAALMLAARTTLGTSLGLAAAGLVTLIACRGRPGGPLIAGVLLLVMSRVVTGHPVSREPGWLLMPAMALHVSAAAFWYGSLGPLVLALGRLPTAEAARVVEGFARVALVAVAGLAAAGILNALVHVDSPGALLTTWYGQLLIMKSTWFTVLLALAAWHKLSLSPRLAAGDARVVRRLRISIVVEAVIMTLVVLISVNLARTDPSMLAVQR